MRELTRVVTPSTEVAWVDAVQGKNLRQIEDLVAAHRPGDAPDDPPDPQVRTHLAQFELSAETFALLRETRTVLDDEHGEYLTDDAFIAALCGVMQDGALANDPSGRARFQIAVTLCEGCQRGWQGGGGVQVPIDAAAVARAECDAQYIGSIDPRRCAAVRDRRSASVRVAYRAPVVIVMSSRVEKIDEPDLGVTRVPALLVPGELVVGSVALHAAE